MVSRTFCIIWQSVNGVAKDLASDKFYDFFSFTLWVNGKIDGVEFVEVFWKYNFLFGESTVQRQSTNFTARSQSNNQLMEKFITKIPNLFNDAHSTWDNNFPGYHKNKFFFTCHKNLNDVRNDANRNREEKKLWKVHKNLCIWWHLRNGL